MAAFWMGVIHAFRFYLLKLVYPMLVFAGKVGNPEPEVGADFYYMLWDQLEPGDILLSKENWKLTNALVPGFWTHAAIYVGKARFEETVVEAIGDGVVDTPLVQWVLWKDHVAVLRFKGLTAEQRLSAAQEAIKHIGEPYDFNFSPGNSAWYCAEIVWYSFWRAVGDTLPFKLRETFGVATVTPEDFWNARGCKLYKVAQCNGPECE